MSKCPPGGALIELGAITLRVWGTCIKRNILHSAVMVNDPSMLLRAATPSEGVGVETVNANRLDRIA